jgi:hypothetical protein
MSRTSKKSIGATLMLVLMGLLVMIAGMKSLVVMIPAAVLVWYAVNPSFGSGRN